MRKRKLKLFVWTEFCPDYRDGLAFAIAKDEESARAMVLAELGFDPIRWGDLTIHPLSKPVVKCVCGGG